MALSVLQGVTMSTVKTEMDSVTPAEALWLQKWEENKWSEVDQNGVAGMKFIADPVVVTLPSGRVHCFATDLNSSVYHKWGNPAVSEWSEWTNTGRRCNGAPIAINFATHRVAVFVIGFDNIVRAGLITESSDTSFVWRLLGSESQLRGGSLSACAYDGRILVVAVEQITGKLLHIWTQDGQVWKDSWTTLGGASNMFCASNPVMISCKPMTVDIFVFGQDYSLKQLTWRLGGAGWSEWINIGGAYQYHPAAISVSPGRIDVFGIDTYSRLQQYSTTITGNEVGTLVHTNLGAASLSSPRTSITSPSTFAVTTKKANGVWQQKYFESSTGEWTPQNGMTVVTSA